MLPGVKQILVGEFARIQKALVEANQSTMKSVTFVLPDIELHELLPFIICEQIFYFKSKYDSLFFLGVGASKYLSETEALYLMEDYPEVRLYAGYDFEGEKRPEIILPEWDFLKKDGVLTLTINRNDNGDFSPPELLWDLNSFDEDIHFPWSSSEENPASSEWKEMIQKSNSLFEDGTLQKIVLSRRKVFEYEYPLDGRFFFKNLFLKNNNAQSSYAIYFQRSFADSFISLTPEKLFSLKGLDFQTISLAASAPRGKTPEEDLVFEKMLNADDKLQREHALVTADILKKLAPLTNKLEARGPEIMKLPYIQHQSNPIHATLNETTDPITLIKLLHPTPAVGGLPSAFSREQIRQLESYKRGSYAAPIGIMSGVFSEFAVGIRSAKLFNNSLTVYAGAGIVKGSQAEEEWQETGTKMNPFLKVINND